MGQRLALALVGIGILSGCGVSTSLPLNAADDQARPALAPSPSAAQGTFRALGFVFPSNPFFLGPANPYVSVVTPRFGALDGTGLPAGGFGIPCMAAGGGSGPGAMPSGGSLYGGYGGLGYGMIGYGGLGFDLPTIGLGCGIGTTVSQAPVQPPPSPPDTGKTEVAPTSAPAAKPDRSPPASNGT